MKPVSDSIAAIHERVKERSAQRRSKYLDLLRYQKEEIVGRRGMGCTNMAHVTAAISDDDKEFLASIKGPNLAVINAYNDMLSAHKPFESYPQIIRQTARKNNATAQVCAGVPAMCDGVTQGMAGMELSLFSRDVIALSASIGLSHSVYDAAMYLGVCDKIVPGLLMAALRFGHLPAVFVPAGPMESGLENKEKARVRQLYAEGRVDRDELLASEMKSYHSPGTCTFYGTANSNQMLMEVLGLHIPGAAFINPAMPLREVLTEAATKQAVDCVRSGHPGVGVQIDERAMINGIVALMATGGSTNLVIHLTAIARCAGIEILPADFAAISRVVPLITRVYPNGPADVNQFHAAGGMSRVIAELLDAGLMFEDVHTVVGKGLRAYTEEPTLRDLEVVWQTGPQQSLDKDIITTVDQPFQTKGGLEHLSGNIGSAIMKLSAVNEDHLVIEAPARVFLDQNELLQAFQAGELEHDFVAVVPYQGPKANGMPELHKLTPPLGVLLDKGYKVALLTDGRMSGASGKVPAAIHLCPEASDGGTIALIRTGDTIRIDSVNGTVDVIIDAHELSLREPMPPQIDNRGVGRELFNTLRHGVTSAETGAMSISFAE